MAIILWFCRSTWLSKANKTCSASDSVYCFLSGFWFPCFLQLFLGCLYKEGKGSPSLRLLCFLEVNIPIWIGLKRFQPCLSCFFCKRIYPKSYKENSSNLLLCICQNTICFILLSCTKGVPVNIPQLILRLHQIFFSFLVFLFFCFQYYTEGVRYQKRVKRKDTS